MKKKILLFSCSIVFLAGTIMSNNGGPGENRTGVTGNNTCGGGGCHSNTANYNNTNTVTLNIGSTPVSTWKPDSVYTVIIQGTTDAPKYGFQLTAAWDNNGNNTPVGTFSGALTGTQIVTLAGYPVFEHQGARTASGGNIQQQITWTAPSVSTVDTVDFYLTVNNVNGTGSTDGDKSTNMKVSFGKATTSVATLNADIKIAAYPNPVTDKLNISLDNAGNGTYSIRVFDATGRTVANETAKVNGSYSTSINAASWAKGMYHVQLQKDGAQRTITVMK